MKAYSLNNLGSAQRRLGEYAAALESFQVALVLKRDMDDRYGEAQTLFNMGLLWRNLEQRDEVAIAYEEAMALFQALQLVEQVARCERALSRL